MVAGIPGAGVGGLFYLISALLLPVRRIRHWWRARSTERATVWHPFFMATGILAGIWPTGWLLGVVVARAARAEAGVTAHQAPLGIVSGNVVRTATLMGGLLSLLFVLLAVEAARILVGRRPKARHVLLVLLSVALGTTTPRALAAQRPLVVRADSAWRRGDRTTAQALYAQLVQADPNQSRAVFRLAQLQDAPWKALPLYRRYVRLETRDPWGFMALGDALADLGRFREALLEYDHAERLLPGERDAAMGRAKVLDRAGRPDEAAAVLTKWVAARPDDGEAWTLLGRERLRAGRTRSAEVAFAHAQSLAPSRASAARAQYARALSAPAVEPSGGTQHDSDGNDVTRVGLVADFSPADGARLALGANTAEISDVVESSRQTQAFLRLSARPRSNLLVQAQGGASHFSATALGSSWTTSEGSLRIRLRAPLAGPSVEVRAQRAPLGSSPLLVANQAERAEGRLTVDVPVGPVRLRATGRAGAVTATGEAANGRQGGDVAAVVPLGRHAEISGQYHRLGYDRVSTAGYFAPRLVETREAGAYFEGGERVTLSADLGAGVQRVAEQNAGVGRWRKALRGWSSLTIPVANGRALWIEAEGYDAAFAAEGVTTSSSWRYLSVSAGLRWSLR
jgi:tetratricopeptide (TPR) repeat protein